MAFAALHITSPGCRTRRKGRPFAPLLFSKRHDRTRVGRSERSERSRQPGVMRWPALGWWDGFTATESSGKAYMAGLIYDEF